MSYSINENGEIIRDTDKKSDNKTNHLSVADKFFIIFPFLTGFVWGLMGGYNWYQKWDITYGIFGFFINFIIGFLGGLFIAGIITKLIDD